MHYKRPTVVDRRRVAAELGGPGQSGGGITVSPTWRRADEKPAVEERRSISAELTQGVTTSGGPPIKW